MLSLESDFSANDRAQLMTRVQAFVEMLGGVGRRAAASAAASGQP